MGKSENCDKFLISVIPVADGVIFEDSQMDLSYSTFRLWPGFWVRFDMLNRFFNFNDKFFPISLTVAFYVVFVAKSFLLKFS